MQSPRIIPLGEPRFDTSHQEIESLIEILLAVREADIDKVLEQLLGKMETHFGEEDLELRALGGEANRCHLDEHAAVLASIREVRAVPPDGRFGVARRLARELRAWLPGHVQELDFRLAQAMFQRRTGGAPVQLKRQAVLV